MNELVKACLRACEHLGKYPLEGSIFKRLKQDPILQFQARKIEELLDTSGEIYRPTSKTQEAPSLPLKAVAWNIERGKHFKSLVASLKSHAELNRADLFFLTEVDWGMVRSGNRNVAAELGRALNFYAYFAPSYFNFTQGHGSERHIEGVNEVGLHGKAILSRYPLSNLRTAAMPNATDKLKSKEARLGQKRSLIGDLTLKTGPLAVACIHLDAFSSPRMRAQQFRKAVQPLLNGASSLPALIAGDWNTNTINTTSGRTILLSVLRQFLVQGPQRMIRNHQTHPERKFDRPLFKTLEKLGLNYEDLNEAGAGTFDLVSNDYELGTMASDQFPVWVLRWINGLVEKSGGNVSLKLDWFAGRGLRPLVKKVLRLRPGTDYPPDDRPSDHHPVLLTFVT